MFLVNLYEPQYGCYPASSIPQYLKFGFVVVPPFFDWREKVKSIQLEGSHLNHMWQRRLKKKDRFTHNHNFLVPILPHPQCKQMLVYWMKIVKKICKSDMFVANPYLKHCVKFISVKLQWKINWTIINTSWYICCVDMQDTVSLLSDFFCSPFVELFP